MEFKIDTKETFSTITPLNGPISANLTGAIGEKCGELRQSGSKNFIIDLQHCTEIEPDAVPELVNMHEEFYGNEESLVFTAVNGKVLAVLKQDETDLLINIAPSMREAIDIISMEILERDLFNEE
ncbi:MAG: anti-sigma-factor antagonist [Flavipsychrobacter sp.]|nr:anti-sigma-factor antagonist [Flavipsychrobacter sp.]